MKNYQWKVKITHALSELESCTSVNEDHKDQDWDLGLYRATQCPGRKRSSESAARQRNHLLHLSDYDMLKQIKVLGQSMVATRAAPTFS
jgi:hypothetical protein